MSEKGSKFFLCKIDSFQKAKYLLRGVCTTRKEYTPKWNRFLSEGRQKQFQIQLSSLECLGVEGLAVPSSDHEVLALNPAGGGICS